MVIYLLIAQAARSVRAPMRLSPAHQEPAARRRRDHARLHLHPAARDRDLRLQRRQLPDVAAAGPDDQVVRGGDRQSGRARRAVDVDQGRGGRDRDRPRCSARLASFAVARFRFFGRETISFLVVLPIALPGVVTGFALSNTFTQVLGVDLSLLTVIVGHATFCIVVVYNNVIARLRRVSGNLEEASADLGAHTWQTFRFVTLPEHPDRAGGGRAARLRSLLRRDHRHQVHHRRRRADPADLDLQQPLPARTSCRSSTWSP